MAVDQVILSKDACCAFTAAITTLSLFFCCILTETAKKHLLVFTKTILCGKWCFCHDREMLNDTFKMSNPAKQSEQILKVNSSTKKKSHRIKKY